MTSAVELFQQLGFSQYEAQAYLALLRENPLNGYELARASGIPRANIYSVLQKLEERGAVLRLDTPDGARFTPTQPNELLKQLKIRYQAVLDSASEVASAAAAPAVAETVLNLRGYAAIIDHANAIVNAAQGDLLLSVWPEEAAALAESVQQALDRGVDITTLCLRGCQQPCPACRGAVFRYPIAPQHANRWLVLVSDAQELLAGQFSPIGDALAVRTRQSMLVLLSGSYIQNSIALAAILTGLGDRLETVLDAQTLAAINALHSMRAEGKWLDLMRLALQSVSGQSDDTDL